MNEANDKGTDFIERPAVFWAATSICWTVSGLLGAVNFRQMSEQFGDPAPWSYTLRTSLASAWLWIPLTGAIFWLARRHPIEGRWRSAIAIHAAGCASVVLLRALVAYGANPWIGWYRQLPSFGSVLMSSIDHNLLLYWMFVGVAHALHFARRSRERTVRASRLEAQLAEARLTALQAQLHPHFLFNTLHSLSELVHRDVDAADRAIVRLSEILRRTLRGGNAHEVALREELELTASYLEIEQMRFGDRLAVEWDIDPKTLEAQVPHWLLQPLVENALRHGLSPRARPGRLWIVARATDGRVRLEVGDDGVGLADGWESRGGVGLTNTKARLQQLHGRAQHFSLTPAPGGGALVQIEFPLSGGGASS